MQTKKGSLLEVALNILSGYLIAWIIGIWIYPLFGFAVTNKQNTILTLIFTLVSIIRSYFWRRLFNFYLTKKVKIHDF